MREVGGKNEADAASFEAGNAFSERGNRRGMRMPDGDGEAVALGVACGEFELRQDRRSLGRVVEEDFAGCGGHSGALGGVVCDGRGRGAAVDEKQAARPQSRHQRVHERRVGRGP